MDRAAIESFLSEPRLLVLTLNRGDDEPFVAPVWHEYRDGRFYIWTNQPTAKTRLAQRNPAATLLVQTEAAPYKAVLVRGTAEVVPFRDRDLVRRLAVRYLGETKGTAYADAALAGASDDRQGTLIITPTAWRAWDYAESNADATPWTRTEDLG